MTWNIFKKGTVAPPSLPSTTAVPIPTLYGAGGVYGSGTFTYPAEDSTLGLTLALGQINNTLSLHNELVEYLSRLHPEILQQFFCHRDAAKKMKGD